MFDFIDYMKDVKEKEIKRQILLELVDYVIFGIGKFMEFVFEDVIWMLVVNLFCFFLFVYYENMGNEGIEVEDEEFIMDFVWLYL